MMTSDFGQMMKIWQKFGSYQFALAFPTQNSVKRVSAVSRYIVTMTNDVQL